MTPDATSRTAILLLNMGGPVSLDKVQPFLLELFCDRDIIQLGPSWMQPLIARLIVALRLKEAKARYQAIGGQSPILRESASQARALRQALRQAGYQEPVRLCFRYSQPRAAGVLKGLQREGFTRVLPVSLYPHDCRATTGSSVAELQREAQKRGMEVLDGVLHYATHPRYLDALEDLIRQKLAERPGATLVWSAHSLPLSQIQAGDPYEREIQATVQALQTRLGDLPGGYRLAYQSKVGPVKWLEPSLQSTLEQLKGHDLLICPVSFVSEHIETLHELDLEYREWALKCGAQSYQRVPALGVHPGFIASLVEQILEKLKPCY